MGSFKTPSLFLLFLMAGSPSALGDPPSLENPSAESTLDPASAPPAVDPSVNEDAKAFMGLPEPAAPSDSDPAALTPPPEESAAEATSEPEPAAPTVPAEPPATARQYLEAGAKLHNKGRYELAARYLKAASLYKDRLTPNEQVVLDVYREKVEKQLRRLSTPPVVAAAPRPARFPKSGADPEVKTAATTSESDMPDSAVDGLETRQDSDDEALTPMGEKVEQDPLRKLYGSETWRNNSDSKQRGRWLLQLAREQIFRGHYDKAKEILATVRTMDITWGYFDDTPEKVTETLTKAETEKRSPVDGAALKTSGPGGGYDRRTAKARLREARAALVAGDLDQAEAIANEVRSWRIGFYFFDDTPEKVLSTIDITKRRIGGAPSSKPTEDFSGFGASSPTNPDPSNPDGMSAYLKGTRFAPASTPGSLPR